MLDFSCPYARNSATAALTTMAIVFVLAGVRVRYRDWSGFARPRSTSVWWSILVMLIGIPATLYLYFDEAAHFHDDSRSMLRFYDDAHSRGQCLGLSDDPDEYVVVTGYGRLQGGFVQCEHKPQDGHAPRSYWFSLPNEISKGSRLTGVRGAFFIDEAGKVNHSGVKVAFSVLYGGQQLCQAIAQWKKPGRCRNTVDTITAQEDRTIELREQILVGRPSRSLFAGALNPVLEIARRC
jgi:hypothetical protein